MMLERMFPVSIRIFWANLPEMELEASSWTQDIKLENVMVASVQPLVIKLIDFGQAGFQTFSNPPTRGGLRPREREPHLLASQNKKKLLAILSWHHSHHPFDRQSCTISGWRQWPAWQGSPKNARIRNKNLPRIAGAPVFWVWSKSTAPFSWLATSVYS